jgi:hypothetical protein
MENHCHPKGDAGNNPTRLFATEILHGEVDSVNSRGKSAGLGAVRL